MWFFFWLLIALVVHVALTKMYTTRPPLLIEGSWMIASINVAIIWNYQGDVAAANTSVVWGALLIIIHVVHWLYIKAKTGAKQLSENLPTRVHIDDSIYEQIAEEMSNSNIYGGLMTRAIAETDGDQNRANALYIKLRAAAIATAREPVKYENEANTAEKLVSIEQITQETATQTTKTKVAPLPPPQIDLQHNPLNEIANIIIYVIAIVILFSIFFSVM